MTQCAHIPNWSFIPRLGYKALHRQQTGIILQNNFLSLEELKIDLSENN